MSSGTPVGATTYSENARIGMAAAEQSGVLTPAAQKFVGTLGMNPRQQEIARLWAHFRCGQYDNRKVGWDGKEVLSPLEREAVAHQTFMAPGFVDFGSMFSIQFRRPTVKYHIVRIVVERFTGLLFSETRHPQIKNEFDAETQSYAVALANASRLWAAMIKARNYGGATGTAIPGFSFIDGRPRVEVFDPRYATPHWRDRAALELRALEVKYCYPEYALDEDSGEWRQIWFWYRRVIDEEKDVLFLPEPVATADGELRQPQWKVDDARSFEHRFDFVPAQWIQNLPVDDAIDGEPDMPDDDVQEPIDALLSQAHKGTVANADPTPVLEDDDADDNVQKGSAGGNAIQVSKGGDFKYAELAGTGAKVAMELADRLRTMALELASCILDHPDVANRTATEVARAFEAMTSKADMLREQYGEKGVRPLLEKMVRAARSIAARPPRATVIDMGEGATAEKLEQDVVTLPDVVEKDADGNVTARHPQELGESNDVTLEWPPYFAATVTDQQGTTSAAVSAFTGKLLDHDTAVRVVCRVFNVDQPHEVLKRIRESLDADADRDLAAMGLSKHQQDAHDEIDDADKESGVVVIDEIRAAKGLGPHPDRSIGVLTVPQLRARFPQTYATNSVVQSAAGGPGGGPPDDEPGVDAPTDVPTEG